MGSSSSDARESPDRVRVVKKRSAASKKDKEGNSRDQAGRYKRLTKDQKAKYYENCKNKYARKPEKLAQKLKKNREYKAKRGYFWEESEEAAKRLVAGLLLATVWRRFSPQTMSAELLPGTVKSLLFKTASPSTSQ